MPDWVYDMLAQDWVTKLLCDVYILAVAAFVLTVVGYAVYCSVDAVRSRIGRRCRREVPWRHDDLYVDMDDWQLWDVQWRRVDGRIEVAYSVANWLPGQHEYRNDFIRVFQRGVSLEERGVHVSRVLLKGAEVRFSQVFDARDGSALVIQRNSLDTERKEGGAWS